MSRSQQVNDSGGRYENSLSSPHTQHKTRKPGFPSSLEQLKTWDAFLIRLDLNICFSERAQSIPVWFAVKRVSITSLEEQEVFVPRAFRLFNNRWFDCVQHWVFVPFSYFIRHTHIVWSLLSIVVVTGGFDATFFFYVGCWTPWISPQSGSWWHAPQTHQSGFRLANTLNQVPDCSEISRGVVTSTTSVGCCGSKNRHLEVFFMTPWPLTPDPNPYLPSPHHAWPLTSDPWP